MNRHIDRIVFAHDQSDDFSVTASSMDRMTERKWQQRLRNRIRSEYGPERPPSTVYWNDSREAAVIRRLPSDHRSDGRGDRAHVLVGRADLLDPGLALRLPGWPRWTDASWHEHELGQLRPKPYAELPAGGSLWDRAELAPVNEDLLWPLVHAFRTQPNLQLYVVDTRHSEPDFVLLIRALVGIASVLAPQDREPWTFSTRETRSGGGGLNGRSQFLSGPAAFNLIQGQPKTEVAYPYRRAMPAEEENCRNWVRCYLVHGPDELARMLAGGRPPEDMFNPMSSVPPAAEMSGPVLTDVPAARASVKPAGSRNRQVTAGPADGRPGLDEPSAKDLMWLVGLLPGTPDDELPELCRKIAKAPPLASEQQAQLRSKLLGPASLINQRLGAYPPGIERVRMACGLVQRAIRDEDWGDREIVREIDQTMQDGPLSPAAYAMVLTAIEYQAASEHPNRTAYQLWGTVSGVLPSRADVPSIQAEVGPVTDAEDTAPLAEPARRAKGRRRAEQLSEWLPMALWLSCATVVLLVLTVIALLARSNG